MTVYQDGYKAFNYALRHRIHPLPPYDFGSFEYDQWLEGYYQAWCDADERNYNEEC